MSEASFWDYLRKVVLPVSGHYSRIEAETAQGFPDVHYTIDGFSGVIELKAARTKRDTPFSGSGEGLRKSQLTWMDDQDKAGGRIWVFAEVFQNVFVIDGNVYREEFNSMHLGRMHQVADVQWIKGVQAPATVRNELRIILIEPL